jgi:hypothetical protein
LLSTLPFKKLCFYHSLIGKFGNIEGLFGTRVAAFLILLLGGVCLCGVYVTSLTRGLDSGLVMAAERLDDLLGSALLMAVERLDDLLDSGLVMAIERLDVLLGSSLLMIGERLDVVLGSALLMIGERLDVVLGSALLMIGGRLDLALGSALLMIVGRDGERLRPGCVAGPAAGNSSILLLFDAIAGPATGSASWASNRCAGKQLKVVKITKAVAESIILIFFNNLSLLIYFRCTSLECKIPFTIFVCRLSVIAIELFT